MFRLIKKIFMGLQISMGNASNRTKCVLLSNQKYMIIEPILINSHPSNEVKNFTTTHFQLN